MKHKMSSYPYFRRNGDDFYKIVSEGVVTKISPDSGKDYYDYAGLTGEDEETVMGYDEMDSKTWDDVKDDVEKCSRVGSRPNIPPPPH